MRMFRLIALTAVTAHLAGCAVSSRELTELREAKTGSAKEGIETAKKQLRQEGSITHINGNYLGDTPIEMPYAAKLPATFFELITIKSKGSSFGSINQAAKNIGLATGIPVRVSDDIDGNSGAPSPSKTTAPPAASINLNQAIPGSSAFVGASNLSPNAGKVRLDWQGSLLAYVKHVANSGGVEWEYRDGSIYFYRLVTKTFTVFNVSPGEHDVSDVMAKGGLAKTGSVGGETAVASGDFTSKSSVGMKGTFSVWKLLKPAIESAISAEGRFAINEASGTVTVTDNKDAVARIEKIIERENAILGRQVAIDVRVIRVQSNNSTQAGINLNAVYSLFNNAGSVINSTTMVSGATQTTATSGSMTFAVSDPISRFDKTAIAIAGLNSFGTIISDTTSSVSTTNRVPAMTGSYDTAGYLAQTTPAAGGALGGGSGVPGLTPGSVTTGSFLRVLPTVRDNNTVLLNMSVDISDLLSLGSASTGTGATLQQIQWANTGGTKTTSNLLLNQGESMVMVAVGGDGGNSTASNGVGGASAIGTRKQSIFVIVVTPRIMRGI